MFISNRQYEFDEEVEVFQVRKGFGGLGKWEKHEFVGILSGTPRPYLCRDANSKNHFTAYARIRKIRPRVNATVRIDGHVDRELSDKVRAGIEKQFTAEKHDARLCGFCSSLGIHYPGIQGL